MARHQDDSKLWEAEFSFEAERAREAFITGWCYARWGDDPDAFAREEAKFMLWEVTS